MTVAPAVFLAVLFVMMFAVSVTFAVLSLFAVMLPVAAVMFAPTAAAASFPALRSIPALLGQKALLLEADDLFEFAPVEPYSLATGADVDLHSEPLYIPHLLAANRAVHDLSSEMEL
jgi:hypothetical protein